MTRPDYPQPAQNPHQVQYPQQQGVLGAPAPAPKPQPVVAEPVAPVEVPDATPIETVTSSRGADAAQRVGRSVIGGVATVAATAEAGAQAQPVAAAALAIGAPGHRGPRGGTVYGAEEDLVDLHTAPAGRQPRLHIGWHTASPAALEQIGVSTPGAGLILGSDHDQKPVMIRFFRPEPTRVTLVGGVWAGQMVAFRALALGAQVVVMTNDPSAWHGFGERAVGRSDLVVVLHGEQPGSATGTALQPVLVVHDLGTTGPVSAPPIGPWQTHLTVLRRLNENGLGAVQRCDLLMMQRLAPDEAQVAEYALRLTGQHAQLLQMMEDEMLALIGGGANRYLWFRSTTMEKQFIGAPWR
jgi:hypothetical protein